MRDRAAAKPRRMPGPSRCLRAWVAAVPDDQRPEVVELLDDVTLEAWRVVETLAAELDFPFGVTVVNRWRRGEYVSS